MLSPRVFSRILALSERLRGLLSRPAVRWGLFFVLVVASLAGSASMAFAETAPATKSEPSWYAPILFFIGALFLYFAQILGKLVAALIETIVIPIMQYNSFSTSPVVSAGWAIVRDSMNLFFVIILIVIAVGTIFGVERFKWQQQVPRLLLMALVINFSKTITGIMIDASQVVMLTFVNALKDIAGGNFVTLLGLNKILSINANAPGIGDLYEAGKKAADSFDYLAASVAGFLMMTFVLATIIALAAILAFRIVMLWILIVVAPIAFFLKGAEGVIDSSAYKDWWKNLKCFLVIGPVLAFFLWLALAVAGSGNLAATENFVQTGGSATGGFISSIFELSHLTSFIIGMALIFAGFKAAAEFCAGAEGSSFITGALGKAKAFGLRAPAGLLARGAARITRGGLRGAASLAGGAAGRIPLAREVLTRQGQAGLMRAAQRGVGAAGKIPVVGGLALGAAGLIGRGAAAREGVAAGAIEEAGKGFEDKQQAENYAAAMGARGRRAITANDQRQDQALLLRAMTDADLQKAMGGDEQVKKMLGIYGENLQKNFGDDYKRFAMKRPDLAGTYKDKDGKEKKWIDEIDTEAHVRDLGEAAFGSTTPEAAEMREKLKKIKGKSGKSMYEDILAGKLGLKKQEALQKFEPAAPPPPPMADLFKAETYNPRTGQFATDETEQAFTKNLKADITSIKDIDPTAITKNSIVVNLAAEQMDSGAIQRLSKDYLRGDPAKMAELEPALKKAKSILDLALTGATGKEKSRLQKLQMQVENTITLGASIKPPAPPDLSAVVSEYTARQTAAQKKYQDAQGDLDLPKEDLDRLRSEYEQLGKNLSHVKEVAEMLEGVQDEGLKVEILKDRYNDSMADLDAPKEVLDYLRNELEKREVKPE